MAKNETLPRGIRNNNPGNIEWGAHWQGLINKSDATDQRFAQFKSPAYGIRALAVTLITYQDKRRADDGSPIDTVQEAITRWAPPDDKFKKSAAPDKNPTNAYAKFVANCISDVCGEKVSQFDIIDFHDYKTLFGMVSGMIRYETGTGQLKNINTWYPDEVINEGLRRAGVVKPAQSVMGIPMSTETKAAGGVAALGLGQLADVAPSVMDEMTRNHDDITSGDWVRIGFGVASIIVGIIIAWNQVKRHRAGAQ